MVAGGGLGAGGALLAGCSVVPTQTHSAGSSKTTTKTTHPSPPAPASGRDTRQRRRREQWMGARAGWRQRRSMWAPFAHAACWLVGGVQLERRAPVVRR
eukprot:SAG25_NODE_1475_length_2947_cov_2.597612_2_plen_99_part_00